MDFNYPELFTEAAPLRSPPRELLPKLMILSILSDVSAIVLDALDILDIPEETATVSRAFEEDFAALRRVGERALDTLDRALPTLDTHDAFAERSEVY